MSVEMTSGVLAADITEGMRFALGPTMVVRKECVDEVGGFGILGDYCADDFVLGNLVAEKGHTVILSNHVIDHIVINERFVSSVKHQVRWMKSTRFSRPLGHLGTALTFSVPFGILAGAAALALHWPILALSLFAWSVLSRAAMAWVVGAVVVRDRHLWRLVLLYPLRDFLGFCYWVASYFNDKIVWRGRDLSPGEGRQNAQYFERCGQAPSRSPGVTVTAPARDLCRGICPRDPALRLRGPRVTS